MSTDSTVGFLAILTASAVLLLTFGLLHMGLGQLVHAGAHLAHHGLLLLQLGLGQLVHDGVD